MNARGKLNQAYLNGALIVAVLAATITQSGFVFLLVLAALLTSSVADGSIRMGSRGVSRPPEVRCRKPRD